MLAVLGLISAVKMRTTVQQVATTILAPHPLFHETKNRIHQQSRTVRHSCINHLTFARFSFFKQRRNNTKGEHHAAAAKITHQVQWRCWARTGFTNGVQHTR